MLVGPDNRLPTDGMVRNMAHNPEEDLDRVLRLVIEYMRALRTPSDEERHQRANAALEEACLDTEPADIAMSLSLIAAMAASFAMDVNPEDPYRPILDWGKQVRTEQQALESPAPDVQ